MTLSAAESGGCGHFTCENERRIIRRLHKRGMSIREIAEIVERDWHTVRKAVDNDYTPRAGPSEEQKKKMEAQERHVRKLLRRTNAKGVLVNHSQRKLSAEMKKEGGVGGTSPSAMGRILKRMEKIPKKMKKVVKEKPYDPAIRRVFLSKINFDDAVLKTFAFSDEKFWYCDATGHNVQYCRADEEPRTLKKEKYSPKLHVWGIIGVGFRLIIRLEGRIDSPQYQDQVLKPLLRLKKKELLASTFVQDGATCHTSKSTIKWLKKNNVKLTPSFVFEHPDCIRKTRWWPPRSPKLNCIEDVWATLQRRVAGHLPNTSDELWEAVEKEFYAMSEKEVRNYVLSFGKRARECLDNRGKL